MFINKDIPLRVGGRKAPKISVDEFISLLDKKFADVNEYHSFYLHEGSCVFVYDMLRYDESHSTHILDKFYADCEKINFEFENVDDADSFLDVEPPYVCNHICVTASGVPYIPIAAGGDWEFPLLIFLYWDGKSFRGYIPTKGNTFNSRAKSAFGNYSEDEAEYMDDYDESKTDAAFLASYGISMDGPHFEDEIKANYEWCLEDFETRLEAY